MAALAFKAIGYGAEKIPDRLFEKIPGGFFTPAEKKRIKKHRDDDRRRSEQRQSDRGRRQSHQNHTPSTDSSDHSNYDDTEYEQEYRDRQRRHRTKSLGRSYSRSLSRGRYRERTGDLDGEMDRIERGPEPGPSSPSTLEYKPYNPQEYAPASATMGATMSNTYYDHSDRRASLPPRPEYGYPPQPQPQLLGAHPPMSSSAAKYTPAGAYTQSPSTVSNPPQSTTYPPYNPADYVTPNQSQRAPVDYYPPPPPFYRQQSRSQPSLPQYPPPDNQLAYLESPSRRGSTPSSHQSRHGDGKNQRARSAGHHGSSRSRVTDQLRDRFDNLDIKEKTLAASVGGALAGGLAGNAIGKGALSTLVGAAIGGIGGRELEKRHEKKTVGHEASLPLQEPGRSQSRHRNVSRDYPRSPSRDRWRSGRFHNDSDSDSYSDGHRRAARRRHRSSKRQEYDD